MINSDILGSYRDVAETVVFFSEGVQRHLLLSPVYRRDSFLLPWNTTYSLEIAIEEVAPGNPPLVQLYRYDNDSRKNVRAAELLRELGYPDNPSGIINDLHRRLTDLGIYPSD
jgi:hypothetical protein